MRPYFSSFALVWGKAKGSQALSTQLDTLVPRFLPHHMQVVHKECQHMTAFANFKVNFWNGKRITGEAFAEGMLKKLTEGKPELIAAIQAAWKPVTLEAYELTCFDSVLAVQFRSKGDELAQFRLKLNGLLQAPIAALVAEAPHPEDQAAVDKWKSDNPGKVPFESLCMDPNKNSGGNAFGSLARSPVATDEVVKQWVRPIGPIEMTFYNTFFTVSNESLTNPGLTTAIKIGR